MPVIDSRPAVPQCDAPSSTDGRTLVPHCSTAAGVERAPGGLARFLRYESFRRLRIQEAVTGAPKVPDRSPSSTRAPKSFGRRDVNRCAKVLGVSVDFEATDWLALAHGPIVDIMITYGVLRGVVRLLDRRGRGTSPHLIVRRQIRRIRKR